MEGEGKGGRERDRKELRYCLRYFLFAGKNNQHPEVRGERVLLADSL